MNVRNPLLAIFPMLVLGSATCLLVTSVNAQQFVANYDESKIPDFQLPDPLTTETGQRVLNSDAWVTQRRPEILRLFESQVYGRAPERCEIQHSLVSSVAEVMDGKCLRREVDVSFGKQNDAKTMRLLIFTPQNRPNAPVFVGFNFQGNHTVDADPSISLTKNWVRNRGGIKDNRANDSTRGSASGRWPIEMILDRGYAVATIYYGDVDPDFDDGFENGIHGQFQSAMVDIPKGERWGSIAAWAYALSRAVDYFHQDDRIDETRVAVIGHSRLGKTSLWAGATDPRFKLVISNNSGCGGAALSRRAFGETVGRINTSFPHWFCDNFLQYNENENACPVDQHQLLALIAPRAVYVASATEDRWADPHGEFLSCLHADPVYRLLGKNGLGGETPPQTMPSPETPIKNGAIGYHLRTGKHDVTEYDWAQYLDFADHHLR